MNNNTKASPCEITRKKGSFILAEMGLSGDCVIHFNYEKRNPLKLLPFIKVRAIEIKSLRVPNIKTKVFTDVPEGQDNWFEMQIHSDNYNPTQNASQEQFLHLHVKDLFYIQ